MATNSTIMAERVMNQRGKSAMLENHKRRLNVAESVNKAKTGKALSLEKKMALATVLENTERFCNATLKESATNSKGIPSKAFYMDMLTAVVPNLIASDIVSTQALESKTGMISYLRFMYGSDKGATTAGTMFNNSLYTGFSDPNYTSRLVNEEYVTNGVNFEYIPIIPTTVNVVLPDGTRYVDDGQGNLKNPVAGTNVGTIDYATGAFTCATATSGSQATYEYDNETVPDLKAPQITMDLAQIPIFAKSRKLTAYWGFDAAYDLQQQFGQEIDSVLATQAAGEIAHEIDTEIVADLYAQAGAGPELTWNKIPPTGVNVVDHYDSFWVRLTEGAKIINRATQRVEPNFIVCGTNVAAVIECMRNFEGVNASDAIGPHFIGTLGGKYKVYMVPLMDENTFVMGYKGTNFLETGYVYAPYMPILSTDLLMPADFRGQQGYATSYGKKMINAKMYLRGRITG